MSQPQPANAPPSSPGRRRLLFLLGLTAALGLFATTFFSLFRFLKRPAAPGEGGGLVAAGTLAELPAPGAEPQPHPAGRFWLVHGREGVLALSGLCTHLDCRFHWDGQRQRFLCPCHGSEFSESGELLRGPAKRSLDRFAIILTREQQELRSSTATKARPLPIADLLAAGKQEEAAESLAAIHLVVDTSRKIRGESGITAKAKP